MGPQPENSSEKCAVYVFKYRPRGMIAARAFIYIVALRFIYDVVIAQETSSSFARRRKKQFKFFDDVGAARRDRYLRAPGANYCSEQIRKVFN